MKALWKVRMNTKKARKNQRAQSHCVNGRNDCQALQMLWTKVKLRSFGKWEKLHNGTQVPSEKKHWRNTEITMLSGAALWTLQMSKAMSADECNAQSPSNKPLWYCVVKVLLLCFLNIWIYFSLYVSSDKQLVFLKRKHSMYDSFVTSYN